MDKKKKPFSRILVGLLVAIPTLLHFFQNIGEIIKIEANQAGQNIVKILIIAVLSAFLLATTWLCVLGLLFLYFLSLQLSAMLSLFFILVVNIVLLFMLGLIALRLKHKLLFPMTRQLCKKLH